MDISIDPARLLHLFDAINGFGRNPVTGGYDRPAFGEADMAVRRFFLETMERDGLETRMDAAGNVFGRIGPAGMPAVMIGSHLDTVPSGGAFDGALGCAAALECARTIWSSGLSLARAIEVVATADEEGRFGGMLGSQAMAGALPPGWADAATDPDGVRLADAMRGAGLDVADLASAARPPGSVHAFLELHIEQGPVLEAAGCPVGIATAVSGCTVLDARLVGIANHSGTTPMDMRRDAFVGLARLGAALPGLAGTVGGRDSRLTIGQIALSPNAAHTIPGEAQATVIVRDVDAALMARLSAEVGALSRSIAAEIGLEATVREKSSLAPVSLDADLAALLAAEAARRGIDALPMPSGAGHDAQTMAAICPSALVFVPSRGGISHAPGEWTSWADIERGVSVLCGALASLVTDRSTDP